MSGLNPTIKDNLKTYCENLNNDDVKLKRQVREILLDDEQQKITTLSMLTLLDNKELIENEAEPFDYLGVNIFPYLIIEPTQTKVSNFICYETSFRSIDTSNVTQKYQYIYFQVYCHQSNDIMNDLYGLSRHDILGAMLIDKFNFYPMLGGKVHLISDEATNKSEYCVRTLVFEQYTDNNIAKNHAQINKIYRNPR